MSSWCCGRTYGRTILYKYNCQSLDSPGGVITLALACGSVMAFFRIETFVSTESTLSFRNTYPGSLHENLKWWYFRMLRTALKLLERNYFQSRHCQVFLQSCWYGIATLLDADFCTTSTSWLNASTSLRRNSFLICPKPLSTKHRVCPGICIFSEIVSWNPIKTLQQRYDKMYWFLFWPLQLSACKVQAFSPKPYSLSAWSSMLMTAFEPLVKLPSCPMVWFSSFK